MRSDAQAKLLRVIEEKTVLPIGGTEEIPIDVRFLAASNRPPNRAIVEGRLREDLYYRLNGLLIQLPPLRGAARRFTSFDRLFHRAGES
jgi:transcriptional regulator with PAS, ATPase and Fis domain